ncbi:hypothetical protein HJG60_009961 [Phyllostomus discolor]|uniref:Uncharacterized protein n=1 Tax=Phyllostomus discolor TaxID=89673 RepID=A0A834B789_9CHIR|nr:hypothetical protein HJG60_009961 [Phyllostomus discolor]
MEELTSKGSTWHTFKYTNSMQSSSKKSRRYQLSMYAYRETTQCLSQTSTRIYFWVLQSPSTPLYPYLHPLRQTERQANLWAGRLRTAEERHWFNMGLELRHLLLDWARCQVPRKANAHPVFQPKLTLKRGPLVICKSLFLLVPLLRHLELGRGHFNGADLYHELTTSLVVHSFIHSFTHSFFQLQSCLCARPPYHVYLSYST